MNTNSIAKSSIVEISDSLRNGSLSAVRLTTHCIEQHKKFGRKFNAYKFWDPQIALDYASVADESLQEQRYTSVLQGIPISVKDIYGLPDCPIYAGSSMELPEKFRKPGPLISTLTEHKSVFMGKTHTVEFAYGGLGINNHWETPWNPWDKTNHRCPGGSSSGAGISLIEGSALVALGTDTAGSVRLPASYTGNVGLRTTAGRWSTEGIVPLSPIFDTAGFLTRTAQDASQVFVAIDRGHLGFKKYDEIIRTINALQKQPFHIAVPDGFMWDSVESSIAKVCKSAVDALAKSGCQVVKADFPEAQLAIDLRDEGGTVSAELIEFLQSELPQWLEKLDPIIRDRIQIGGDISAIEFLRRMRSFNRLQERASRQFKEFDFIVSPTVPISPPLVSDVSKPEDYMKKNLLSLQNTGVCSFLNLPAITVPVGLDSNGMPVGLQIMSPPKSEIRLLAAAQRLESIIDTPRLVLQR